MTAEQLYFNTHPLHTGGHRSESNISAPTRPIAVKICAQHEPYKTTLAKYGYPEAGLAAALDALNAYAAAFQSHTDGQGDAKKATADRNAAYTALVTWDKQFRKIAKVAVRTRPDLAKKLNL